MICVQCSHSEPSVKKQWGEIQNASFHFHHLECLVFSRSVVGAWGRKSYLGSTEISCCVPG